MIYQANFNKTDKEFFSTQQLRAHIKHHETYHKNLQILIDGTEYADMSLEEIIIQSKQTSPHSFLFNNASQVYNHNMFFEQLSGEVTSLSNSEYPDLFQAFAEVYGVENDMHQHVADHIKNSFSKVFGSGWIWVVLESYKEFSSPSIKLLPLKDGDTPLVSKSEVEFIQPLIAIDLWEHAFYLDYTSNKDQYVDMVMSHIDWKVINDRYHTGTSSIKDYTKPFEL